MVDLTQSLLKAISIIADRSAEEVSSDKTIKAVVKKIVSTSDNKYLVTYNDGDFYAYVQSGSKDVYQVDEQVYILVPEGDMSQKKFIIGKVENDKEYSSFKTLTSSLLNDYVTIGSNAVIENEYSPSDSIRRERMQPLQLNSHEVSNFYYCYLRDPDAVPGLETDSNDEYLYNTSAYPSISVDEESFANSAKQAEALLIRAKFKAAIDTDDIGNYGIIVNVAFADETNPQTDDNGNVTYPPRLIAYVLDTSKMTGNPMQFYSDTSQYTIAPFDGQNYLYIDSIVAFSEGFVNQQTNVHTTDEYLDDPYIYIDGLEIIGLSEIAAINGDYKLRLTTPKGNTLKVGRKDQLKITATTTYLNQDITDNTTFYWGVKDPLVTTSSNEYNAKIGSGYRYISNDSSELILTPADLTAAENIFICTAVYESDIILKTSVSMYNNNNKLEITIESDQGTSFQFNEGNPTLTCLINGKTNDYQKGYDDDAFSFVWSKEDDDFGTILLDATETQLEAARESELQECNTAGNDGVSSAGRTIMQVLSYYSTRISQIQDVSYPDGIHKSRISCKLKNTNTYVTYSCSVYRGGAYIGYGSITLQNSKEVVNTNYYITITNGTQVFQYDEAGVAPNSEKNKEPIEVLDLTAVFHSPQGAEVTPKKVRWVMPQGKTLINIPSLGLETDSETGEKYFIGNIYPLSIKDTYDNTCNDNQLIAVVTHADGTEYRQPTNLLFTKVGEIGTNGTDTVLKINETIDAPTDEYLTIIKSGGTTSYNARNVVGGLISADARYSLEANLYTNNTQTLGHTTQWTIAGSSGVQGRNYKVENNTSDNTCKITYNNPVITTELDNRIIKAQASLKGKYFYSFYGMPAIEYTDGYTYQDYPIKIMRDGTLKTILYDSNGTNPSYNENQGIHVELSDWDNETGYLEWKVESGLLNNGTYESPNLRLSKNPSSKTGSTELTTVSNVNNIQSLILQTRDVGNTCAENASVDIKKYINEFLADIEAIGIDTLLSVQKKIEALQNRLAAFNKTNSSNTYVRTVYDKYHELFEQMETEYQACKDINEEYTEIYDKVQSIWASEWPSVITNDRLCIKTGVVDITNIQQLINKYQQAYDDRSNTAVSAVTMPVRANTFQNVTNGPQFITLINNIDQYYTTYVSSLGSSAISLDSILVEYAKVLMTYLNIIVNETQSCLNDSQNILIDRYSLAYTDWSTTTTIGKSLYDAIVAADNTAAGIYDNMRGLYQYYQGLYSGVQKYQIDETSETLDTWNAILNGQKPDLLNQIYIVPNETFNGLYMNNNVVGTAFIKQSGSAVAVAKIYIPIIMTLNTYELAALNGWDGTTVDIGDDHIMTPQIGAGIKDSTTNTFTGMVMGVIGNTSTTSSTNNMSKLNKVDKVGLVGYSNGQQSVFIDSRTGKAYFGLPGDDINTLGVTNDSNATTGTNEGRIELIPGGVSKIGNWKIGSRFLYNIVEGNYERRVDKESRYSSITYKMMVPHDKHGIILSANQPYIHVKGEVYEDKNLPGINYSDEYNDINPGDSLELRLDPGNKSLFSIIQHTLGFGDENIDDLFFGYKNGNIIKNYVANQNTSASVQKGAGAEYYIYKLVTVNGEYQPYYSGTQITKNISTITSTPVMSGTGSLGNISNCFSINNNTGTIIYNPANSTWSTGWQSITEATSFTTDSFNIDLNYSTNITTALNNNINIGTVTNNSGSAIYEISFQYTLHRELINIGFNDPDNVYVQFYLVSNSSNNIDNAILVSNQFSIWSNCDNIDAHLYSYNGQDFPNGSTYYLKARIYVGSYIVNANKSCTITRSSTFVYDRPPVAPYGTIQIDGTNSNNGFTTTPELNGNTVGGIYTLINNQTSLRFRLTNESKNQIYDFVVWRKGNSAVSGGGRTYETDGYATFFWGSTVSNYIDLGSAPTTENPWNISFYPCGYCTIDNATYTTTDGRVIDSTSLVGTCETGASDQDKEVLDVSLVNEILTNNENVRISVTFLHQNTNPTPRLKVGLADAKYIKSYGGTDLTEDEYSWNDGDTIIFVYDGTYWCMQDSTDTSGEASEWNTSVASTYIFSGPSMISQSSYSINLSNVSDINISYGLNITDIDIGTVYGYIPSNSNVLCIQGDDGNSSLQGIPYAQTYWVSNSNESIQKIRFYKEYYSRVNNDSKNQYGYIDVTYYNGTYYKYIKTLRKSIVNNWFDVSNITNVSNSISGFTHSSSQTVAGSISIWDWIDIPISSNLSIINNALYWKEFTRVGLDENGRFFSAGTQDQKTYSRTGKIHGFGQMTGLYGQEIRAQLSSNTYMPIIKIFSQTTNSTNGNTTYITQNENDGSLGNLSIRTAGNNHYIELAASESSENSDNSVPDKTSYIQVSHNNGVQIQVKNQTTNTINLTNTRGLSISVNTMLISSGDVNHQIVNNYTWTKSPYYVISSLSASNASTAYKTNSLESSEDGSKHYRIRASSNGTNPIIELQAGNQTSISVSSSQIVLKADKNAKHCIEINNSNLGRFVIDKMKLQFEDQTITLQNGTNTYITMTPTDSSYSILASSGLGGKIEITAGTEIKGRGGLTVSDGSGVFMKNLYTKSKLYSSNDLHVGYTPDVDSSMVKGIYLYKDTSKHYVRILASDLQKLFDWYNKGRWAIGYANHTLWLTNVQKLNNPEGSFSNKKYTWKYAPRFNSYYTGDNAYSVYS